MRLIDADKLYPDCMTKNGTLAISQSQIANAPTVESPKGAWIELPDNVDHLKCSVCGDADYYDGYEPKFCPNCGAQMTPGKIPERMELITEHNFIVKDVNYDVKYCVVDGITMSCPMLFLNGDWYFCIDDRYHWYLVKESKNDTVDRC